MYFADSVSFHSYPPIIDKAWGYGIDRLSYLEKKTCRIRKIYAAWTYLLIQNVYVWVVSIFA